MALQNTVTVEDVAAECPELSHVSSEANLLKDIDNAFKWLKAELKLKWAERIRRTEDEDFDVDKIPDGKNPEYMRIVIARARFLAFRRVETQADTGSHAYSRDYFLRESEDLIRRTPLYYDVDESGTIDEDERIQTGTRLIR